MIVYVIIVEEDGKMKGKKKQKKKVMDTPGIEPGSPEWEASALTNILKYFP